MSKYYIYKMTAITEEGSKGSYIGQHKISKRCPMKDGYKGSGVDWKKNILDKHIPTEKVILRLCNNIEEANYWEDYYIERAREEGIYLWNRYKGGGGHEYGRLYTDEEIKQHRKQYSKQYREANKEAILQHRRQYREANKEEILQHRRKYYEEHKEEILQHSKRYREVNKAEIQQYQKQYYEVNKAEKKEYKKQYNSQRCQYNGEILTLCALRTRFRRAGIKHPTIEAKKYLISE